jgi:hypothetical protein
MVLVPILTFVVMVTSGVCARPAQAQEPATNTDRRTVWAGVYTDAQAAPGKIQYEARFSSCHREGPRKGDAFRDPGGNRINVTSVQTSPHAVTRAVFSCQ